MGNQISGAVSFCRLSIRWTLIFLSPSPKIVLYDFLLRFVVQGISARPARRFWILSFWETYHLPARGIVKFDGGFSATLDGLLDVRVCLKHERRICSPRKFISLWGSKLSHENYVQYRPWSTYVLVQRLENHRSLRQSSATVSETGPGNRSRMISQAPLKPRRKMGRILLSEGKLASDAFTRARLFNWSSGACRHLLEQEVVRNQTSGSLLCILCVVCSNYGFFLIHQTTIKN